MFSNFPKQKKKRRKGKEINKYPKPVKHINNISYYNIYVYIIIYSLIEILHFEY